MAAAATSASAAAAFSELTVTPDATAAAAAVPAAAVVHLALVFRVSLTDFNLTEQQRLKESLALAAGLTRADAQLVTLSIRAVTVDSRRTADGIQVDAYIACRSAAAAASVAQVLTPTSISSQLQAAGLAPATIVLAAVVQLQASL
jgi:ribosomal protein RSM22 (predicted rRNA methylase)